MDYQRAKEIIGTARNVETGKPIANNTRMIQRGENIAIRLHQTDIITFKPSGAVVLNTGGWKTVTTKARINEFSPVRVWSNRGTWYAGYNGASVPFADGMTVYPSGHVKGAAPVNTGTEEQKTRKQASNYARAFIDALYLGKVPPPSAGDCWGCCMRDKDGKTVMGSDHIRQHIEESYFVPSLLVNAMKAFGTSHAAEQTAHAFMQGKLEYAYSKDRNDFIAAQLQKTVRRFVLRNLGLAA